MQSILLRGQPALTEEAAEIYLLEMKQIAEEVGMELLLAAVRQAIREASRWPLPSDLRRYAGIAAPEQDEGAALAAFTWCCEYIHRHGAEGRPKFEAKIPFGSDVTCGNCNGDGWIDAATKMTMTKDTRRVEHCSCKALKMIPAPRISAKIYSSLRSMGGLERIEAAMTDMREFGFVRRDFLDAYRRAPHTERAVRQLESAPASLILDKVKEHIQHPCPRCGKEMKFENGGGSGGYTENNYRCVGCNVTHKEATTYPLEGLKS